jgi:hypothetical protein
MLTVFGWPATEDDIAALLVAPPVVGLTDGLYVDGEKRWYHLLSRAPRTLLPKSAWNEAVTTLRDVGLLAASREGDDRLDTGPLVREHFREQLMRERPEALREGHRRLGEHFCNHAAWSASELADLLRASGELSEALTNARKSVELADGSGDVFTRIAGRTCVAAVLHAAGLRKEAAAHFEEAERLQKEHQPAYPLLYSVQGFRYCDLLLDQGRHADVQARATQTLAWAEEEAWQEGEDQDGWLLDVALDNLSLGRAHFLAGRSSPGWNLDFAAARLTKAVDALRCSGAPELAPLGLLARAALMTHTKASLARRAQHVLRHGGGVIECNA